VDEGPEVSDDLFSLSTASSGRRFTLPRLLFWLNLGVAGALASLVGLTPLLDDGHLPKLVALFSRDSTVRQTALASAVALAVVACVFFRPALLGRSTIRTPRLPPPTNVVGA
jgi:hypothetical protein